MYTLEAPENFVHTPGSEQCPRSSGFTIKLSSVRKSFEATT
ncbi:hypothetical protein FTUN_0355 [Frigoriglobus tundricola]|uniref:Uncharacterized protein n=1 Tax=Frigoriglobus tundricola TaxID=2774151 RepID=A0A6M5YFT6_9BACT|nr:hypothetical protein FTUN_0355 [Frigoriglobus tundricola]